MAERYEYAVSYGEPRPIPPRMRAIRSGGWLTKRSTEAQVREADWTSGVLDRENCTPEGLRHSARIALRQANEWADTAERLLAKAADLEAGNG